MARIFRSFGAPFAMGFVATGCGQVTGLSDDYTFDLEAGADAESDAGDAGAKDAGDGAAAAKCQAQATNNASTILNAGSADCRACLASNCCTEVVACYANNGACKSRFACMVKCTERATAASAASCFGNCDALGSDAVSKAMSSCSNQNCVKACAF